MTKKMRLRQLAAVTIVVAAHCVSLSAQDWTTKRFASPADEVYKSAVRVIGLHYEIQSQDPQNRLVRFHIGVTALSWGYNVGLAVEPQSNGTSVVKVGVEKSGGPVFSWGSGKKQILQIFAWMDEDLLAPRASEQPPENGA